MHTCICTCICIYVHRYQPPRDTLTKEVARLLSTPTEVHAMFATNVYLGEGGVTGENRLTLTLTLTPYP